MDKGLPFPGDAVLWAAEKGSLDILEWMLSQRLVGHLRAKDPSLNRETSLCNTQATTAAATNDHFEVLQWLVAHNYPWDVATVMNAAEQNGNCLMLQWVVNTAASLPQGRPSVTHDAEHYLAQQWFLTTSYRMRWSGRAYRWVHTVAEVSRDRLLWLLCPDVVTLIHRYC